MILLLFRAMANHEIDEIEAIDYLSEEFDFYEGDMAALDELLTMAKFTFIASLAHENDLTLFGEDDFEDDDDFSK